MGNRGGGASRRRPARLAEYISDPMLLIPAHAKVNLCLAVRGRRADGFHDIDSVMVTIDWHDLVGVSVNRADATSVRLRVSGDTAGLPADDANLVAAAGRAVAAVAGPLDIDLWLGKRVPREAGLGGGSADAAAVLRACASLLGAGVGDAGQGALDPSSLLELGASLGSDVPMLISGGTQRVRGRGERLAPVSAPPLHLAVAIASTSSTAAVYGALESFDFEEASRPEAVTRALESGQRPNDDLLGSGLERAACRVNPALDERIVALRAAVREARWHLTGSGGAAFALAESANHAAELASAAASAGFPARGCRTISG
jgi:4-diphosphocytidyl-2-C-methyl-D-erythritol kinase